MVIMEMVNGNGKGKANGNDDINGVMVMIGTGTIQSGELGVVVGEIASNLSDLIAVQLSEENERIHWLR